MTSTLSPVPNSQTDSYTLNHEPYILSFKLQTLNAEPYAPNPEPFPSTQVSEKYSTVQTDGFLHLADLKVSFRPDIWARLRLESAGIDKIFIKIV